MLKKLRNIANKHADKFDLEGFTAFFAMLNKELDDEYFIRIQEHLKKLKFHDGVLLSVELGQGNKGVNYLLRKQPIKKQSWIRRLCPKPKSNYYTFYVDGRDESGHRVLSELNNRGLNLAANVLASVYGSYSQFF